MCGVVLNADTAMEVYMKFLMYTGRYLVYWHTRNNAPLSISDLQKSVHKLKKNKYLISVCFIASGIEVNVEL